MFARCEKTAMENNKGRIGLISLLSAAHVLALAATQRAQL